jgi:3(or 17)beta-hydroxysteroid dehydrogenase
LKKGQGSPDDLANLVLFLASDESVRITGTYIVIDQGETIK